MTIETFERSAELSAIVDALQRCGAVIVTGLIDDDCAESVVAELRVPLEPPEASWRTNRGQVAAAGDARAQGGD